MPSRVREPAISHLAGSDRAPPIYDRVVFRWIAPGAAGLATIWLLQLLGVSAGLAAAALSSLLVGGLALGASTLHLGRPIHAYRALRMWRRSWLSREVLLFSAFSAVAGVYAAMLWFGIPGGTLVGAVTVALGVAGEVTLERVLDAQRLARGGVAAFVQSRRTGEVLQALALPACL